MSETAKILIVDDDLYVSEMYSTKFREEPMFQIQLAGNGKEALEKVSSFMPDLMLLDVIMPTYDGFEVLKTMHDQGSLNRTKVIILSNLGQREDIEHGLRLGAADYIIKAHFTPSEVVQKVKTVLAQNHA